MLTHSTIFPVIATAQKIGRSLTVILIIGLLCSVGCKDNDGNNVDGGNSDTGTGSGITDSSAGGDAAKDSQASTDTIRGNDAGTTEELGTTEDTNTIGDTNATGDSASRTDAQGDVLRIDGGCTVGTASNSAAATNPSLFGQVVPFADGVSLPAGSYAIKYVDGCFKFASNQGWTIHARLDGSTTWWLVGATSSDRIKVLPGTVGIFVTDTAYQNFADCVAANQRLPPEIFEHQGGPLGIFLTDTNYPDNVPGEDGRNPAWELTQLDCD